MINVYTYIYTYSQYDYWAARNVLTVLMISIRIISNRGSQIPDPLLIPTSRCPLKVQISQRLASFSKLTF